MKLDKQGTVQYIQIVPEMGHLLDLDGAFAKAKELVGER